MSALSTTQPHLVVPHGLTAWDWIHVGIIVGVAVAAAQLTRTVVGRALGGDGERVVARLASRFLTYLIFVVGLVYALVALRVQIGPLLGALGIGGIALAFALQDILQNLVAGVLLQARRPFRRGDQVHIDRFEGVVEDIDLRNVELRTFDGLNVFVPNKTVLENPIVNYTRTPTRRTSLTVAVDYDSDLGSVRRILLDTVRRTPAIEPLPAPAVWVERFSDSGVDVTLLFWHDADRVSAWQARSDVAIAVKSALDAGGVTIPFPQRVLSFAGEGRTPDGFGAEERAGAPRRYAGVAPSAESHTEQ